MACLYVSRSNPNTYKKPEQITTLTRLEALLEMAVRRTRATQPRSHTALHKSETYFVKQEGHAQFREGRMCAKGTIIVQDRGALPWSHRRLQHQDA